jgi:hypothetical protein
VVRQLDYVTLDSWIYPAFDRLHALGYADTAFMGLRPWTRLSCLHILEQTAQLIERAPDDGEAKRIFAALTKEFGEDGPSLGGRTQSWMNSTAARSASQAGLLRTRHILGRPSSMTTGVPMNQGSTGRWFCCPR